MANALYLTGCLHHNRAVRIFCMGCLYHACLVRSLALFKLEFCAVLAAVTALYKFGISPLPIVGWALLSIQVWCWVQASQRIEHIAGHRAGAKGYSGAHAENTIEAMQALLERDNGPEGPVPALHYVEVDIQETADGEIAILHDFHLGDAFPAAGINEAPYQQLRAQTNNRLRLPGSLHVKDVTVSQLQSLHLAGRPGLRAPTLQAFMAAFRAARSRWPLVIEIKRLQTDAGRERLLSLLREHQQYAAQQQQLFPQNAAPRLGFLALISFPHFYAASMGELGSKRWAYWARRLKQLGIPVRCCFLDCLDYTRGV